MKYLLVAAIALFSSFSDAETVVPATTTKARAEKLVQAQLLSPLARKDDDTGAMSRRMPPPKHRQVRVLDEQPKIDRNGNRFLRFAVDERFGFAKTEWKKNSITGCAYLASQKVYVNKGGEFRHASFLLGKYSKAVDGSICKSAKIRHAQR